MSGVTGRAAEGESSPAVSSSGVGTRSRTRTRSATLASMTTVGDVGVGVNVEDSEVGPAEMGSAPDEEKVERTGTGKRVPRRAAKQGRVGITIKCRTAATTAKAKTVTSARSSPDPTGVIKTSSGRIVTRNARYNPREVPPATLTGNGEGNEETGPLVPTKRGRGRPPKRTGVPPQPPKNGSGSSASASKTKHGGRLSTGASSSTAQASSSPANVSLIKLRSRTVQSTTTALKPQQSTQKSLPPTQVLPSTSAGAGGTASTSSSLPVSVPPVLRPPVGQPPKLSTFLPKPMNVPLSTSHTGWQKPGKVPIPPVLPEPPQPPNFKQHLEETLLSLSTHKTFPIDKNSMEFTHLEELLSPLNVTSAEQVANPDLWQRFCTARKEMLRTKSSDLNLLSKLFPFDKDVLKAAQLSLKFNKDPRLATEQGRYSPNETLLFHCVRDPNNLESILSQGLDERLGNEAGNFGKGIYFSDDTMKSAAYDRSGGIILIFAVLLGDCLRVTYHSENRLSIVREPEKKREQKRCLNDKFFDSITSSSSEGGYNEYVIYNRYLCCPLYLVKYKGRSGPSRGLHPYCSEREDTPAIAWVPGPRSSVGMPMPNQSRDGSWPFLARTIFKEMGVTVAAEPAMDLGSGIKCLVSIGFPDEDLNRRTLQKYGNDLNKAVESLMLVEHAKSQPKTSTSKASSNNDNPDPKVEPTQEYYRSLASELTKRSMRLQPGQKSSKETEDGNPPSARKAVKVKANPKNLTTAAVTNDSREDENDQPNTKRMKLDRELCDSCCIGYAPFDRSPELWKELKCGHRLCVKCYNKIETARCTMAGVSHTFVKCPFCQEVSGTEVGTCPVGKMDVSIINVPCSGYPLVETIQITYDISTGQHSRSRIAYLPNNQEGHGIMKLLETAWDRRLCFMIGTSMTTGRQNVPVWNIQHKTKTEGGPQKYGYPDPGYFQRVREELKAYGIE